MSNVKIEIDINSGPTVKGEFFSQTAVEVSVTNLHASLPVKIDDLRLMFSRDFGALVQAEAPPGRTHPKLPAEIAAQTTQTWYFHADELSRLLADLYRPTKPIKRREVLLHVQCIFGTKKVQRGPWFMYTTDQQAHFPAPDKLRSLSNIERLYRAFQAKWKYVALLAGVVLLVLRIFNNLF